MPRDVSLAVMPPPVLGAPPLPRVPLPERWTLPGGLRVLSVPRTATPQVVLRLVVPAGAVLDPPERPGTASMVGSLLTEGTAGLTPDALNARLDFLGAAIGASVGHDFAEVEALLLRETLEEGVALLAEIVTRPAFPEREVERARAESLDALVGRLDEPANVADDRTALEVFGADHPYGRPPFGTRQGIEAMTRDDLVDFHARCYRPEGAFLVAVGDFDPALLERLLGEAFAGWTGRAPEPVYPPLRSVALAAGETIAIDWEDAAQSEIRVAGVGPARRSDEWVAAAVANYVLGGSTITGRLGANLREEKGWTYGVRSSFSSGVVPGEWATETAVDVEVTRGAVRELHAEMRRMMDEPVPAEELRRAKDALILSLPRAFETPGRIASRIATLEAYGLPADYWATYPARVEAVTAEEVQRIARTYFDPARTVTVVVGEMAGEE